MKVKPLQSLGIIAIILALCAIGWVLFRPRALEPVVTYKATVPQQRTTETSQTPQASQARRAETPPEKAGKRKERWKKRRREEGKGTSN